MVSIRERDGVDNHLVLLQDRQPLHEDLAVSLDFFLVAQRLGNTNGLGAVGHGIRMHVFGGFSFHWFLLSCLWIFGLILIWCLIIGDGGRLCLDFESQEFVRTFERIDQALHGHVKSQEEIGHVSTDLDVAEMESEPKDPQKRDQKIINELVVVVTLGIQEVLLRQ